MKDLAKKKFMCVQWGTNGSVDVRSKYRSSMMKKLKIRKHPASFGHKTGEPIGFHKDVVISQSKLMLQKCWVPN